MGVLTLFKRTVASVATPSSGKSSLFIDSATGQPYLKDETGTASALVGAPTTRSLTAGAGLTGGGDLSADRAFNVGANADGSIVVNADDLKVGVLATDAQHGNRGNGALHSVATTSAAGFQSAADKAKQDDSYVGFANVLDFGADPTGTTSCETALSNAIASMPNGGVLYFPTGTYLTTSTPYIVSANNIILRGAGPGFTYLKTNNTTGDQLRLSGYGTGIENVTIQGPGTSTTSNKTSGTGLDLQGVQGYADNCDISYQYIAVKVNGTLVDYQGGSILYFNNTGIAVTHNSDHRIANVLMNNAAQAVNGIDVQLCASLLLYGCNIVTSGNALNLSPATGVTVPSVKGLNCFFDTSVVGLNMTGAGSVPRCEFTNCWFSSMTTAGIRMNPTTAGGVNGLTFVNCDIYQNVGGTTVGVDTNANVGKWKMVGCSIAGWTTGINLVAGAAHFPSISSNTIGAVSAFAANATGIALGAGAFKGFCIQGNDVVDNTTAITIGAFTATDYKLCRIVDNAGINPKLTTALTPPVATPVSATVYTNNTGYRVAIYFKATTAITAIAVNGIATAYSLAAGFVTVEPGATFSMTGTGTLSWSWIGM